jgi:hypothetical protein
MLLPRAAATLGCQGANKKGGLKRQKGYLMPYSAQNNLFLLYL